MQPQIVALGEILIDFTQESEDASGYPVLAAHPGGAPANYLAAAQKYGAKTAMLGKVGDDRFGRLLMQTLKDAGIETRGVRVDENTFTTLAFVTLDSTGNREFSFARKPGADTCLQEDELDTELLSGARILHFGTLSLSHEPSRTATEKALGIAKEHGAVISFDPNIRLPLWKDPECLRARMDFGFRHADLVKISEEEIDWFYGCDPKEGAERLRKDYDISAVFVTLGKDGCMYSTERCFGKVAAPKAERVVDTTGAGDIFGGSLASRLLPRLDEAERWDDCFLRDACTFACAAATLSTAVHGGISSVPELENVLMSIS